MTATTIPTTTSTTTTSATTTSAVADASTRRSHPVLRATAVAAVAASAGAMAFAAVARAAGVPFRIDGEQIPVAGFATLTLVGVVVGALLLAALNRYSSSPRRRFVQVTVALTALSCIPSLTSPPDTASKLSLAAAHVVAAAIAVPVLARRARG